ncbi:MAG: ADP-ribosylglycohydrolase family protein [Burkholderiales bacterium]|nr:ADP-ribosylglycohydrolase family protein [Burkholderiales bacterium]
MLLEIAIGDAYGAGFEFGPTEKIRQHNHATHYQVHELGIAAGNYTDDTQMSIAVAEVLLASTTHDSDAYAAAFVRCYQRDPRLGYAKGLQELFGQCQDGAALRRALHTPNSRRNGAAMRAVPLALIADIPSLRRAAQAQAAVTHNSAEGLLSAQVVALIGHFLLYQQVAIQDIPALIAQHMQFALRSDWSEEVACDALQTIHAVNTALLRNRRMSTLLRDCVNFGGDVDSVAAIAMGLASLTDEYEKDIPVTLLSHLENGAYGKNYLHQLDAQLAAMYPQLAARLDHTQ